MDSLTEAQRVERRERLLDQARQWLADGVNLSEIIRQLHDQDASIIDSIWIMRLVTGGSLAESKDLVTGHPVWDSMVRATEPLHDALEKALLEGDEAVLDEADRQNGAPKPVIRGLVIPPCPTKRN